MEKQSGTKVRQKKTCASAQVGVSDEVRKAYHETFTNQYLWDCYCRALHTPQPAEKRKRISANETRYCDCREL
ncbi:hypothetical protein KATP_08570 [Kluyvera ascorbata]|nr:hypothetical protein KATP_08570 [Kluyvera ascorbata]